MGLGFEEMDLGKLDDIYRALNQTKKIKLTHAGGFTYKFLSKLMQKILFSILNVVYAFTLFKQD